MIQTHQEYLESLLRQTKHILAEHEIALRIYTASAFTKSELLNKQIDSIERQLHDHKNIPDTPIMKKNYLTPEAEEILDSRNKHIL